MQIKNIHHGFSIIEVMISIFVFALGLTSVFVMLSGSISMSNYSKNLIIASHLANEELELFKNIRDSNYSSGKKWSYTKTGEDYDVSGLHFEVNKNYKLDNNLNDYAASPIRVELLPDDVQDNEENINYMNDPSTTYRLCLTSRGVYTYDCADPNVETKFYRYLRVVQAEYDNSSTMESLDNAFKVISKVIWVDKTFHSTEISTVVTDWKRY